MLTLPLFGWQHYWFLLYFYTFCMVKLFYNKNCLMEENKAVDMGEKITNQNLLTRTSYSLIILTSRKCIFLFETVIIILKIYVKALLF